MRSVSRSLIVAVTVVLSLALAPAARAQDNNLAAFKAFVVSGQYDDANFYLANGFVTAAEIDQSQLFYDGFMQRLGGNLRSNRAATDVLYNYLAGIGPIDLNRPFACRDRRDPDVMSCLLVNDLITNVVRPNEMEWFISRGLNPNLRDPAYIPATVPLMVRFGSQYTLNELNWFVASGMVLGDEGYTLEELLAYRDPMLSNNYPYDSELDVPANFLNLGDQNFLDLLVIVLGSPTTLNDREESARQSALCSFITYAASAYIPSFDYLNYLLETEALFRGDNIGSQVRGNGGVYSPFPTSCVLLVQAMATSHAQLEAVISRFAAEGDVKTAEWLITIKEARN